MFKRLIPLVAVLSLLVASLATPAFANDDTDLVKDRWTVLDYRDFVISEDYYEGENYYFVQFPREYIGIQEINYNGSVMNRDSLNGSVDLYYDTFGAIGLYVPQFYTGYYILDARNIPSGSTYSSNVDLRISHPVGSDYALTEISGVVSARIAYYDADMNVISWVNGGDQDYSLKGNTSTYHIPIYQVLDKPAGTVYISFYWIMNFNRIATPNSDPYVTLNYSFSNPILQISVDAAYKEQQQLDEIINGTVDPELPEGSGSVGDLDDLEGGLKDDTAAGRDEAEEIFNESSGLVASHMSGFLFLSNVIERMLSVGWLRGVVVISLSLGILGFLANIAMIAGRNGRDGRDAKSTKGG